MTDIQKFDPSTLMQGVRDRIKSTFVALIPDDQWELMVQKEIDAFFKEQGAGYQNRDYKSAFQTLCRDILNEYAQTQIKEHLKSPKYQVIWEQNGMKLVDEGIQKMIIDNAGQVLLTMIQSSAAQMVMNMQNLPNQGRY